jgi:alkylhydroperoxidase family enzyme
MRESELDESFYSAMGHWETTDQYSAAERLAIEYAERYCLDHLSLDDEFFDRLRVHFSEGDIFEMTVLIGRLLGFARMTQVLQLDFACPIPHPAQDAEKGEQASRSPS